MDWDVTPLRFDMEFYFFVGAVVCLGWVHFLCSIDVVIGFRFGLFAYLFDPCCLIIATIVVEVIV